MAEKVKYLSEEWRIEAEKRLRAGVTPEMLGSLSSSMSVTLHDKEGGKDKYMYIAYQNGTLDKMLTGEGAAPDAQFRVSGDYEAFSQLVHGKLNAAVALMTGKIKLKGDMVKAMKFAPIADKTVRILSSIPAEF